MGRQPWRLIGAVVMVAVIAAGGWVFGVRHDVDGLNDHLLVGNAIWGFDEQEERTVSVGFRPCTVSGRAVLIDGIVGEVLAGDAEIVGVVSRTFSFSQPGVGSSVGFPPPDPAFEGVTWDPLPERYEVTKECFTGTEGTQEIVVGIRFGARGGAIRPVIEFSAGLLRYEVAVEGVEVVFCGPALEGDDRHGEACLDG